jgi:hypothetical protein
LCIYNRVHMFSACRKVALCLALLNLGAQSAPARPVETGAVSVSPSQVASKITSSRENLPAPAELSRCLRSSKRRKEISCLDHQARKCLRERKYPEAEVLFNRDLAILNQQPRHSDERVTRALRDLALTYLQESKWDQAEPIYRRLLRLPVPAAATDCAGTHYWGDQIRCYVTFRGEPDFTHVEVVFNLPTDKFRQEDPAQPGKFINFVLRDSQKIDRDTYAVSGILSDSVPGIYILAAVSASSGRGYRLYTNGYAFWSAMAMRVKAPAARKTLEPGPLKQPVPSVYVTNANPELGTDRVTWAKPSAKTPLEISRNLNTTERRARSNRACGGIHKPGDTLICYVVFENADDSNSVQLDFGTPVGAIVRGGLCNGFFLDKSERIDARTFRVSGSIPWCTSFKYVLTTVLVQSKSRGNVQYQNGADFKSDVIVQLKNSNRTFFPGIKSVSPEQPARHWWQRLLDGSMS